MSSVCEKQRDILFEACKSVATNKRCPEWIAAILRDAVIQARNAVTEDFPDLTAELPIDDSPLKVGETVKANLYGTECIYKIMKETEPVEGIRLFHIQFVSGVNKGRPVSYNVPETMLKRFRG